MAVRRKIPNSSYSMARRMWEETDNPPERSKFTERNRNPNQRNTKNMAVHGITGSAQVSREV